MFQIGVFNNSDMVWRIAGNSKNLQTMSRLKYSILPACVAALGQGLEEGLGEGSACSHLLVFFVCSVRRRTLVIHWLKTCQSKRC